MYNRIEVLVAGVELEARPIDFEMDNDGNPISAIKFETVCPKCGNMIQFDKSAPVSNGKPSIGCSECGAKAADVEVHSEKIQVAPTGQTPEANVVRSQDRGCPFIDPITERTFLPAIQVAPKQETQETQPQQQPTQEQQPQTQA